MITYTKCDECVKSDVCGIKDKYSHAVKTISNCNISNEDKVIYEARYADAGIKVDISCPKFLQNEPRIKFPK